MSELRLIVYNNVRLWHIRNLYASNDIIHNFYGNNDITILYWTYSTKGPSLQREFHITHVDSHINHMYGIWTTVNYYDLISTDCPR